MKIIVPGKIPDPNIWEGICGYCNCEFECTDKEIETLDDPREQKSWTTAICPTCDCTVTVLKKKKKRN